MVCRLYFGFFNFAKKKIKYDLARAEADSMVTGRLADIIANIFNIKIFTAKKREQENFASVTKKNLMPAVRRGISKILQTAYKPFL